MPIRTGEGETEGNVQLCNRLSPLGIRREEGCGAGGPRGGFKGDRARQAMGGGLGNPGL